MFSISRIVPAFLGGLFLLAAAAPEAQAGLRFSQTAFSVGEVRAGAPLTQAFRFCNEGATTVEILEAHPSCGCLTPRLAQRVFLPGEAGAVVLEVNTLGQTAGPHTWQLTLRCRCGEQSEEVLLEMTGRVVTELLVRPAALLLLTGGAIRQEVVLTDLRPQPLEAIDLRTSSEHLRATLVERQQDGAGHLVFRIALEMASACPLGQHDETLDIFTHDPLYEHLKVPVTIVRQSRERLAVLPAQATFRAAPGQALPSQLLRVRDAQGERVVIEDVTADDPAVRCRWASGPDNFATVRVQIEPDRLHEGRLDSAVHIKLSGPVRQTLTVPLSCVIE